jgi:hypothetical protein
VARAVPPGKKYRVDMLAQLDDVGTVNAMDVNAMERNSRLKDGGGLDLPV